MSVVRSDGWNTAALQLEAKQYQSGTLVFQPSRRWFMPTYTMRGARLCPGPVLGDLFTYDITGDKLEMEFSHWAAKPVYWLWRRWVKVKGFVRRLLTD